MHTTLYLQVGEPLSRINLIWINDETVCILIDKEIPRITRSYGDFEKIYT